MKYLLVLLGMLLLSGCATTVSSANAICGIEPPTFTIQELQELSEKTVLSLDRYFARLQAACALSAG